MRFIDTNILVYSISEARQDAKKREAAIGILDEGDCALSVQVLQEFYVQATRASRPRPLPHEPAVRLMQSWMRFPVVDMTTAILRDALAIRERHRFNYWDCAIVAAARASGCDTVFTEDLTHGQIVEGVRIVNPFR